MLNAFATWLAKTPLTAFLGNAAWAVPAIQTVHILSVAVVFGGAVFINLRILGVFETGRPIQAVLGRFLPPLLGAVAILLVTGLLLIASEPNRAIFRTVFWLKMGLILVALAATWGQARRAAQSDAAGRKDGLVLADRVGAILILGLWTAVIFAGRWIGYVSGWPGAPT